jgi:LysR family nitrogen assimilation transcriptional regulator
MLHISQPAVSRAVSLLEAELETKLFIRHGHGVSLTEAGHRLLAKSQSILKLVEQAKQEAIHGGSGPSGIVTLAIPPSVGVFLVPDLVAKLSKIAPNVELRIIGGFSSHINQWIINKQVDLACVHDPELNRGIEQFHLLTEEVFVVARREILCKKGDELTAEALQKLPLILPALPNMSRQSLDSWAAPEGVFLEPIIEVDDHSIMRSLVRAAHGASILTSGGFQDLIDQNEILTQPLSPKLNWELSLIECQNIAVQDAVDLVADLIKETAPQLVRDGKWPGATL